MPDIAVLGDLTPNAFTPSDEISSTTPFEIGTSSTPSGKGPSTIPSKKGPPTTPPKKGHPTTPSTKRHPITPSEVGPPNTSSKMESPTTSLKEGSIMKLLDKKQFKTPNPPIRAFDNVHPSTPSWKWSPISPIQKIPTTIKPLIEWKHENLFNDTDWFPKYNYKFVFVEATQPPLTRAINTGALVVKVLGGALGFVLTVMLIASLKDRKHRTCRGVVLAADTNAVEQNLQTDGRTPFESEPEPLSNDLPPSYYECTVYSMNEGVGEVPPPYTNPEYHKQQQHSFVENERRACSEDVALEMTSELVFDHGRIIERLNLDENSNNNKTNVPSNDNVEK